MTHGGGAHSGGGRCRSCARDGTGFFRSGLAAHSL